MSKSVSDSHRKAGRSIAIVAALGLATIGSVHAGDPVTSDQIVNALQPRPLTRSLSAPRVDPAATAEQSKFIDQVRNRRTRSLSSGEREEIAEIATEKPQIDLETNFDYDSAEISAAALPTVPALGRAP